MNNSNSSKTRVINVRSDNSEDEVDLVVYFSILWKRKFYILSFSILPALILGIVLFFGPKTYQSTLKYKWPNAENDSAREVGTVNDIQNKYPTAEYDSIVLKYIFFSSENIDRLTKKLQNSGFEETARKLANSRFDNLSNIISFEFNDNLLFVHITSKSQTNLREAIPLFRENIEKIIPMYSEKENIIENIIALKNKMAAIEKERYSLKLNLEAKKSKLEKLLFKINSEASNKLLSDNIVLQFDMKQSNDFLPSYYQKHATETQIVNIEEQIGTNNEMYGYYSRLLKMNEIILKNLNELLASSNGNIDHFHSLLLNLIENEDEAIVDYLKAYIKSIEIKKFNHLPIIETPGINQVVKRSFKKIGISFIAAFMTSICVILLYDWLKKNENMV